MINGLEFLAGLALVSSKGYQSVIDKAGTAFDCFDFDGSGQITRDELAILLKSGIRGLGKMTVGLSKVRSRRCP